MTASNLPSWAVNVQCGINPIALHGLIQTTTLTKKKKRLNKKQGLVHLPALACIDKGLVTPSFKVTVEDRVHTHLDLCLQSIPKGWRQSIPKGWRPAITVTDPDNRLIYADWRACHLQLIAYCSGDAAMTQFFESSPDFYTALPVPKPPMPADPDEQAKWRKKVKYALNAYLNGSEGPALFDPKGNINWKQNEAKAFIDGLDTLFETVWTDAGDWCNQLRDSVYDCSRYIAHCEEKKKTRTKRKALGIGLMRLEAEILNTVLDHPTFSESYGGRVIMPMRDGVLVECPQQHQADLAQWLGETMTLKSTDGNQDRADNHVTVKTWHLWSVMTSWTRPATRPTTAPHAPDCCSPPLTTPTTSRPARRTPEAPERAPSRQRPPLLLAISTTQRPTGQRSTLPRSLPLTRTLPPSP
jgi:hypothetical protein